MKERSKHIIAVMLMGAMVFAMILLKASLSHAQEPTVSIRDFSGGLNTNTSPLLLKNNEFRKLHNYLLNKEYGSLVLRKGDFPRTDTLNDTIATADTLWTVGVVTQVDFPKGNGYTNYAISIHDTSQPAQDGGFWDWNVFTSYAVEDDSETVWDWNPYNQNKSATFKGSYPAVFAVNDTIRSWKDAGTYTTAIDTGGITGVYAFYRRPRTKHLLAITPGFGSQNQWSSLMASYPNQYNLDQRLFDYIYKGETPLWATWNNYVHIALPRQRPLITNVARTTHLVPRAPGQVEVVPVPVATADTGNFKLNGTYKYTLFYDTTSDSSLGVAPVAQARQGYVTAPTPLFNEGAILYGFPLPVYDSLRNDSLVLILARTKGYADETRPNVDSFFFIDTIHFAKNYLDTVKYIDSIPDDSLGVGGHPFMTGGGGILPMDSSLVLDSTYIRAITADPAQGMFFSSPGAPKFVSRKDNGADSSWWPPAPDSTLKYHVGWRYMVTKYDTLIGLMSDSSPNLWVTTAKPQYVSGGTDSTHTMHISVPPLSLFDDGQVRVIWRAQVKWEPNPDSIDIQVDTITVGKNTTVGWHETDPYTREFLGTIGGGEKRYAITRRFYSDTILTTSAFFPVGFMVNPNDTLFADSLNFEEWVSGGRRKATKDADSLDITVDERWSPSDNRMSIVKGFLPFKDNLFAWTDDRLFRSQLDTAIFKVFNDIAFIPDDGDVISQVTNLGPNILVFWTNGAIEMFDPVGPLPQKGSPMSGVGCIAPQSLINYGGTIYFGSRDGIRTISASAQKNYGVQNKVISQKINNLIVGDRTDSVRSTLVGSVASDGKSLVWCYPSSDTMYVYYPELDAWSTRDGSFNQATHYDTTSIEGLMLSTSMLYAKVGDGRLFELHGHSDYYDSSISTQFSGQIKSKPYFTDPLYWQANRAFIQRGWHDSLAGQRAVTLALRDEFDDIILTHFWLTSAGNDSLMSYFGLAPNAAKWLSFEYTASQNQSFGDTLRAIDIWARPIAPVRMK